MKVAIYAQRVTKKEFQYLGQFKSILEELNWQPILEENLAAILLKKSDAFKKYQTFNQTTDFNDDIQLMISVGGDGTFLRAVKYIRGTDVPIMGINSGRLGFLANTALEDTRKFLHLFNAGKYEYQRRSLIKIETQDELLGPDCYALNELAFHKKDTSSMITVHCYLDNKFLNSYWADGLIVATPTGSTAYSLSCGGPIITPGCAVHILSPIAPHNLNVRPVVVPDHMPIQLRVEGRERKYLLTIDGQPHSVKNGTVVTVTKAKFMINVVKFEENNFLDTIRNKMMWGIDQRN
ncbi:MAG: NAD kinase [Crocinitomicaceae bacterium]|nr:NAD kinase [Crocinitomicaceae bacterium]